MTMLCVGSLVGFFSAWIPLYLSLLLLILTPLMYIIDKESISYTLVEYSFLGLSFAFVGHIFSSWTMYLLDKIPKINSAPKEWKLYITELESMLHAYVRVCFVLFPLVLIYITLEKISWPLYLNQDIPYFMVALLYFSSSMILLQGKEEDFFRYKI